MPLSLAEVQVAHDRRLLRLQPKLLARKWERMAQSPGAFLRGASALWAEALRRQPGVLRGFPGQGVLVGDLHLANFGTFLTASGAAFHVNDFDETFAGPWAFDVLRLLTSVLLAREELRIPGTRLTPLADAVLEGHAEGVAGARPGRPPFLERLVQEAEGASDEKLLEKRVDARRRLVRDGEKTLDVPAALAKQVPAAVRAWAEHLEPPTRLFEGLEVKDVVRRVAGTGSLGVERLLVLCVARNRSVLVELKEVRGSSFDAAAPSAERLVEAMRRALPAMPFGLGPSRLGRLPVVVHPVQAGEKKLEVHELPQAELEATLHHLGVLAGQVHRNGGDAPARWRGTQARQVVDRAAHLAGLHAHAYLDFCRLVSATAA